MVFKLRIMKNIIAILTLFTFTSLVNAQLAIEELKSEKFIYSLPNDGFSGYARYNGKNFGILPGEDKKLFEIVQNKYESLFGKPSELELVIFSFDDQGNVLNIKLVSNNQKDKNAVYSLLFYLKESATLSIDKELIDKDFKDIRFYVGYNVPIRP